VIRGVPPAPPPLNLSDRPTPPTGAATTGIETTEDEAEVEAAYLAARAEVSAALRAVFHQRSPHEAIAELENWAQAAPATMTPDNRPRYTVGWLVRWQLDLVKDTGLLPESRQAYWCAVWRGIWFAPGLSLSEVDAATLDQILDNEYVAATRRVARAAWKRFWTFLRDSGLPVHPIDWRSVRVHGEHQPARVITPRMLAAVIAAPGVHQHEALTLAVWLASRAGLRVSEVCRLTAGDLVLGGLPYLIVSHSKGGRSRRVSLEHITREELDQLSHLRQTRLAQSGNGCLVLDQAGEPCNPRAVSRTVGRLLAPFNGPDTRERRLSFQSLRAYAITQFLSLSGDVRYAALQAGHLLTATTTGNYLHDLDLRALPLLQARQSPLNRPRLHVPLALLAVLLDRTPQRVDQMVKEFNAEPGHGALEIRTAQDLPDGPRPPRPGRPALYISVMDALRLVRWLWEH